MSACYLRTLTATAAILVASAATAPAADLDGPRRSGGYGYEPAGYRPLDIERWTGFYLGGTLGYGWGEGRTAGDIGNLPFDQSGMLGTVHAGYNWQMGMAVVGVEADIGTGDLAASEVTGAGILKTDLNAMGSLRARAGILATPALLLYATGGLAWADFDFRIAGDTARSETFLGYQVGLGGELKVSEQTSLRLEYIYTGLPEERIIHSGMSKSYDPSFGAVRAGLSFKF